MIRKNYFFNSNQLKIVNKLNSLIIENENILNRSCILCDNSDFDKLSTIDRYGIQYFAGICKKCGLTQQYKYPNKDFINLFYEKYYNDLYAFFKNPEERFISQLNSAKYKYYLLKKFINFNINRNVLEIGCGTGGILSFFKSMNCDVTGIDYENDHLEFARKKNIPVHSKFENINKKFDIIILSHVLEHLVNVDEILDICKNFLKNDGLIYLEVPSIESVTKHYDFDINNFLHIAHVTHFTKKTFINFINLKGFKVKFVNNFIHSIIYPSQTNAKIINNYGNTKKILRNIKINKFFLLPLISFIKMLKFIVKKIIFR